MKAPTTQSPLASLQLCAGDSSRDFHRVLCFHHSTHDIRFPVLVNDSHFQPKVVFEKYNIFAIIISTMEICKVHD